MKEQLHPNAKIAFQSQKIQTSTQRSCYWQMTTLSERSLSTNLFYLIFLDPQIPNIYLKDRTVQTKHLNFMRIKGPLVVKQSFNTHDA